jgi:hypothetical protein
MGPFWKLFVVALLTLPIAAYVAGGLVAARSELPVQRPAVIIGDPLDTEPAQTFDTSPSATPRPDDDDPDDGDDGDDDLPIVRPEPRDLDDDDGDDTHDRNEDDDADDY